MPSRVRTLLRLLLANLLVFFVLFNVLYWSIPVAVAVSHALGKQSESATSVYRSFIGWRQIEHHAPGVNVGGPDLQRLTINPQPAERTAFFFGGSTIWGTGVADAETIPSHFAALTRMYAENFGENGYTAHQSLVFLLQLLQTRPQPDLVVFYDGVNDVQAKCRIGLTPQSHEKEQEFASILHASGRPDSFSHYFRAITRFAERIRSQISIKATGTAYDCHTDPAKAEAVAENLVRDWEFARRLVEQAGGKFAAFLQPVAYFSRTRLDHLRLSDDLEKQYRAVYPRVREKLARSPVLHDLVDALDADERFYFDFCHVHSAGNLRVAERMAQVARGQFPQ